MNKVSHDAILEHFGEETLDKLFLSGKLEDALNDSVQPSFCTQCGEEGPDLEPDGGPLVCDNCKQNEVMSLGQIVLGF